MLVQDLFENRMNDAYKVFQQLAVAVNRSQDIDLKIGREMMPIAYWQARHLLGQYKSIVKNQGPDAGMTFLSDYDTISAALDAMDVKLSSYKNIGSVPGQRGVAESEEHSPVAGAITRRILAQRHDLLSKYGPVLVTQAIDDVADFVGDVEEIGSSDVSGWVRQVEQMLANMNEAAQAKTDDKLLAYYAQRKAEKQKQGVEKGGQVHGQPQWQMPNAPSPTYTPGKPLPQSLQQKLDGKSNTGAPEKPFRMRPKQGMAEAGRNYHANRTGFARGARDPEGQDPAPDTRTWYIRLNGKLIRDKQGNPYSFRGKAAANKAAVKMQAKLFNQSKEFILTTNPNDPQQGMDEGWKETLGTAALTGAMALGSAGAQARVTPDGQGGFTGGLKPSATVTAPADNKPAAEAPKGFSKEYLQKAADPNRTGRYMISVEKAQELLKVMQEGEKDTSRMNKQSQDFYNKNPNFKRDDRETKSLGNNRLATRVDPTGGLPKVAKKAMTPFRSMAQEDARPGPLEQTTKHTQKKTVDQLNHLQALNGLDETVSLMRAANRRVTENLNLINGIQDATQDPDSQFDIIEDWIGALAKQHSVDPEQIWEDFESVDDATLLETAAWQKKSGKNKTGGLNAKGVASYRREHPGSKLQTAVTTKPSKLKPGSKAAKRRKSFCARMSGVKGPMKKPNGKPTRKALALRKWNCHESVMEAANAAQQAAIAIAMKKAGKKPKSIDEDEKVSGRMRMNDYYDLADNIQEKLKQAIQMGDKARMQELNKQRDELDAHVKKHGMVPENVAEEWSQKYKSSINCSHPKGFSQKAHCAGKKKHTESVEMEMVCEDCGMCETHGDHSQHSLDEACWKGYHKEGMKKMFGKQYPNCVKNKNESLETYIRKGECPGCGGAMVAEGQLNEKQDACYHKVKSRYKVWPSAYASGALVQCRKKGAANWGNSNESITQEEYDQLDENLKKWFSDKWVRFGPDGKIKGDCARGDDSEGKPKCLPQSKAHSLGKKGRASAAARKRREDPNPERSGAAINVATKKGVAEGWQEESQDLEDWSKEVNKKLYRAHENQRRSLAIQLSKLEQKHFGSELTNGPLTNIVFSTLQALNKGQMVHYDPQSVGQMPFGNIVGDEARMIAASGMKKYDIDGYRGLRRAGIVDNFQQFLHLRDLVDNQGQAILKYTNMPPVAAWMQFIKDIGWSKDDMNEEDMPVDLNEFAFGSDDGEDPTDNYPCYDCGSTIFLHHTKLCELAEDNAIRDLPSKPGSQHWTGEIPKGLHPISGLPKGLNEFSPGATGPKGPKDYGQPNSSRYIGGNKFVVGTTNNYVLTATIDKWGLEWDEDDEIWFLDSPGAAHIADASEGEIELPPPREQRNQIHDLVTDYLNERNSADLQKVAAYYGHSDDGEMATNEGEHRFNGANGPVSVTTTPGSTVVKRKSWDSGAGGSSSDRVEFRDPNSKHFNSTRNSDYDSGDYSNDPDSAADWPFQEINELSNDKLTQYKHAAAADAGKSDLEGNFKRADKRFSGIVQATKKQFANDVKKYQPR